MYRRAKGDAPHEFSDVVSAYRDSVRLNPRYGGIPHGIFIGFTHKTLSFYLLENLNHRTRQFTKRIDHGGAGLTQRLHLAGVRASTAFNDRARVTEARPFARRFPADVRDHRLSDISIPNQLRQFLFL